MSKNVPQRRVHTPSGPYVMSMTSHNLDGAHIQTHMIIIATVKVMGWVGHNLTMA